MIWNDWIPAFAGMTFNGHSGLFTKPSILNKEEIPFETNIPSFHHSMCDAKTPSLKNHY